MLREQLMELLMECVFDIPMLYDIVSNLTAVRALFEATPKRYLRLAMQNFYGEIKQTIAAIIAAHSLQPNNAAVMDPFLDKYFDGYGPDLMSLNQIPNSYKALQKLFTTYIAIETITSLFVESRVHNLYLPDDGSGHWKYAIVLPPQILGILGTLNSTIKSPLVSDGMPKNLETAPGLMC